MINTLATILISALVSVGSFFGLYKTVTPEVQLGVTLPIAGTTYNLSGSGVSSSATSVTLQSLTIPQTSQPILDADMSSTFYLTLEPGNKTRQEIVSCTTVTQNSGGTATLSGCLRGLSPLTPYTASTTLQFVHSGGSQVIFSDPPQLFNQYASKTNTELISGSWTASSTSPFLYDQKFAVSSSSLQMVYADWVNQNYLDVATTVARTLAGSYTFPFAQTFSATSTFSQGLTLGYSIDSGSDALDVANKSYVDAVGSSGAADANTTTKGIVEQATTAEIDAGTGTGGTSAALFMDPATFALSKYANTTVSTTTTTGTWYATTTITGLSANKIYDVSIYIGTTTLSAADDIWTNVGFNDSVLDDIVRVSSLNGLNSTNATSKYISLNGGGTNLHLSYINLTIDNLTGHYRSGTFQAQSSLNSGFAFPYPNNTTEGVFTWSTTTPITSISVSLASRTAQMSSTTISVYQR